MIFADSGGEAHQQHSDDLSQEERDILKLVVRELAEKIIRKCDKNSDDGLQNREARGFLKDLLRDSGIQAFSNIPDTEIQQLFNEFDIDQNNTISREELEKQLEWFIGL